MNLKLIRAQAFASGIFLLILIGEWAYANFSQRQLQANLNFTADAETVASELPVIPPIQSAPGAYAEMVERPLFIEGRRPIVEAPPEKPKETETGQIDEWSLIGIYSKPKRTLALFSKKTEAKKYLKLPVEQVISGWTLKEIKPDKVILQKSGEEKIVPLRKPREDVKQPNARQPGGPGQQPPPAGQRGTPPKPLKPPVPPPVPAAPNPNSETINDEN
jgi:hypothetical protein